METLPAILHLTTLDEDPDRDKIAALESNQIDPKFLYVTQRQANLWRQVFLKHSPIHGNPEFAKIYRDAFAKVSDMVAAKNLWLIGLGCGTGSKEAELQAGLKSRGKTTFFSAVDVSEDLVRESMDKLAKAGAENRQSLVCDLQSPLLKKWFDQTGQDIPRLITFFGLIPNLMPSAVADIFRTALRKGDILLVSAHLAPVWREGPEELAAAMKAVLPQYDNFETLAWIQGGLQEWNLENRFHSPTMTIGELEGMPAFVGKAQWKSNEPFKRWGHHFSPRSSESLRLFYSLRYTPALFEDFLRRNGFEFELLSVTACRQEGIWAVRYKAD